MDLQIGNLCGVFNIEGKYNKELYDYIDTYQRNAIEKCKKGRSILDIKYGLGFYLQELWGTRIDNQVSNSQFNEYWYDVDEEKIKILWNLYTPTKQRFEYEYRLNK